MLYNIRRVRPYFTQEAAQVLIQALVITLLDYCNMLLAGLPACAINPLTLIQNCAACLFSSYPSSPMSPCYSTHSTGRLWYFPMEQQEELHLPTFRLCSNPTSHPEYSVLPPLGS